MKSRRPVTSTVSLGNLFLRFLGFGCLAFGGPVAQIAMVRRELVDREGWISSERFNRLLGVMQVLPGPEAHELCVHLGVTARGRIGGLLAGLGFMLPGFILMMAMAWAYVRFDIAGSAAAPALWAVQAAALALVAKGLWGIGRHAVLSRFDLGLAVVAAGATALGAPFWLVLPLGGAAAALRRGSRPGLGWVGLAAVAASALWGLAPVGQGGGWLPGFGAADPWVLLLAGLKAGLLTFGGAYAAIPFLRDDAVSAGWMPEARFLDGVALASILPAPLIIFATFVGYVAGGFWGGVAMTVGVFLPAFAFSMVLYDRLEAIVDRPGLHAFLEGVTVAVVGLIAVTLVDLAQAVLAPSRPVLLLTAITIGALGAVLALKGKWAPPVVMATAGLIGWAASVL
ncbi:chromate efflux transporter [Brevundimonas lutea]|uniref:chromate efflux transporter n=1 Tax=Brevundimonas lutea TaxID=2293980 RepID=UPI000F01E6DD|nr:chromate efflux transporter [Brevundimonas lutea]